MKVHQMSVEDISKPLFKFPKDYEIKLFESFAGIGCQRMAFDRAGIKYKSVGISEIDLPAIKSYMAIHGDTKNYGSICDIHGHDLPDIDVFTYSFPCQSISNAGYQAGFFKEDGTPTRSGLVFEVIRILHELSKEGRLPKVLIMENVRAILGEKFADGFGQIKDNLNNLGYSNYYQVMDAMDYGVPQHRERVFMVSILGNYNYEFPDKITLEEGIKDKMEEEVNDKYYLNDKQIESLSTSKYHAKHTSITKTGGVSCTLCARDYHFPNCIEFVCYNGETVIRGF